MGQPNIDDENKVSPDLVKAWWNQASKEPSENKNGDEQPRQEQIRCIHDKKLPTREKLIDELQRLAIDRGGYLLIYVDGLNLSEKDTLKNKLRDLKKELIGAAFQCKPFVPIFQPYHEGLGDNKPLFVVPVPMVSAHHDQDHYDKSDKKSLSPLQVFSLAKVVPHTTIKHDDSEQGIKKLAKMLSALANTDGGSIFLEARPKDKDEELKESIRNAIWCFRPLLDRDSLSVEFENGGKHGLRINIEPVSTEIYSVDEVVCKWKNGVYEELSFSKGEDIDEVYKSLEERCKLKYPVIEPLPTCLGYLKGPHFDAREQDDILRYDPQWKILKWTKEILFQPNTNHHRYKTSLCIGLNRPVELYHHDVLEGKVRVTFEGKVLSGLDVEYFNALGQQVSKSQNSGLMIEKKSRVNIEFDHVTLLSVFQHRKFTTIRKLKFEGVKPDENRLEDIQGMLADLGLENIRVRSRYDDWFYLTVDEVIKYGGEYRIFGSRPDGLWLVLNIKGELANINRERQEGQRIDRMRLQSGRMYITITGSVEGELVAAQELSKLLNRLQRLLKERFSYVRVQVA